MIFPPREDIETAIELLDEHEDGESVGESPISKAENIIDVRFHQTRIQPIGTANNKDNALVLLHFLT